MKNNFKDVFVIQDLPIEDQMAKLLAVGEHEVVDRLRSDENLSDYGRRNSPMDLFKSKSTIYKERLYLNTTHIFGFIPSDNYASEIVLRDVGDIEKHRTLKNQRVTLSLNLLRIASYPGVGTHRVLFNFYAQHAVAGSKEDVHFNATYRVAEGQQAGIKGYPIFVGLNVEDNGISFRGHTINVKNDNDQKILDIIESDVFKSGLKLANHLQPAIGPLSEFAIGLTKVFASRNNNIPVQDFFLGLDTGGTPMGARLAEGDYIIVQIPQDEHDIWNWSDWKFSRQTGRITKVDSQNESIPYNHLVIGVKKFVGY